MNEIDTAVKDPVCGMAVDPASAKHAHVHSGRTYFFCGAGCLDKFRADPAHYLSSPAEAPATAAAPGSRYTCPMHPEVISDRPGPCPKCGMALERMVLSAEPEENPELRDMTRRFWIGL